MDDALTNAERTLPNDTRSQANEGPRSATEERNADESSAHGSPVTDHALFGRAMPFRCKRSSVRLPSCNVLFQGHALRLSKRVPSFAFDCPSFAWDRSPVARKNRWSPQYLN